MADLTPANQNPWYVLSTLKGEQTGEGVDYELATENVRLWNIWACQRLTEEERQALKGQGAEVPDMGAWEEHADEIATLYAAAMKARNDEGFSIPDLPDPKARYDMSEIAFSHTVVWEKAIFASFASFASATFTQDANFASATFTQTAKFDSATFTQAAFFLSATFTQAANFDSATFTQAAFFDSATFTQTAYFGSATFTQAAFFRSATFTQDASFLSAIFTQTAKFDSATFTQTAFFSSATFTQTANFDSATFTQAAIFDSATFTQAAFFTSAIFTQDASFRSAIFSGRGYFLGTKFGDPDTPTDKHALLDLTDTQFDKPASFRGARFSNRFPEFRGTILPEQTLFPFDEYHWPQSCPLFDEKWEPQRTALMRDAANSCAVLRNHVKKQGHPEAEHYFFRREMGFLRQIGPWWQRLPYIAFGVVSDYGHSILRPLIGLFLVWLLAFPIFQGCGLKDTFCVFNPPASRLLPWQEAAGLSFSNMFKFFGFQTLYYREFLGDDLLPNGYKLLASAQTVLSFILLFFLGLGLRQRFRLR